MMSAVDLKLQTESGVRLRIGVRHFHLGRQPGIETRHQARPCTSAPLPSRLRRH